MLPRSTVGRIVRTSQQCRSLSSAKFDKDQILNPSAGDPNGEPGVTTTMMPWRGFYTNLMKKTLGEEAYDKIRR